MHYIMLRDSLLWQLGATVVCMHCNEREEEASHDDGDAIDCVLESNTIMIFHSFLQAWKMCWSGSQFLQNKHRCKKVKTLDLGC
jgi:hypothetical protein